MQSKIYQNLNSHHFVQTKAPDIVAVARVALSGPNFRDVILPQLADPEY